MPTTANFALMGRKQGCETMSWIERLNTFKKQAGLTNEEIARRSGVPKSTVDKIFSGYTQDPQLNTIAAIVQSCGRTLNDLYDTTPAAPESDDGLAEYLQQLRTRPEQRMMLSLTKNATKEEVETAVKIVEAYLKKDEN